MSTLVDERVVEMRFDNRDFEKNTRQSMSTIEKLKSSLNFSGVANSINQSVNSIDMNPLIAGLEKSEKAFNAWEIAAISAISNITNRLVDLGINLVKSLSVDNITSGWQQFGELTRNTGTMINQLVAKGYSEEEALNAVNESMDQFMWYSDATSFKLEQMTAAADLFVQNGKKLEDVAEILFGIGNLGASAGKNAAETSEMYQIASRIGDRVMTNQYESLRRAGFITEDFKNKLLDLATEQGVLTKFTDTFTNEVIYYYEDMEITAENMRDSISKGWLTGDIFFNAVKQYGNAVGDIYKYNKEVNELAENTEGTIDASTAIEQYTLQLDEEIKSTKELIESLKELGDTEGLTNAQTKLAELESKKVSVSWTKAATEARTFAEAVDAVKDAVKTEWSRIFTIVIGDYKKATEIWTALSNRLYDIFAGPLYNIRQLVESNGEAIQKSLFGGISEEDIENGVPLGAIWNLVNAVEGFINVIKEAWHEVFPMKKSFSEIAESIRIFTTRLQMSEEVANNVKSIFKGFFSLFKIGIKILQGVKKSLDPIFKAILGDSGGLIKFLGQIGDKIYNFANTTDLFTKIGSKFARVFETIINTLKEVKIIENVSNIFKKLFKQLDASEYFKEGLKEFAKAANQVFEFFVSALGNVIKFIGQYVIPALAHVIPYILAFIGVIGKTFAAAINGLILSMKKFAEFVKNNVTIQNGWTKLVTFMQTIPDRLKKLQPFFAKVGESIKNFFTSIGNGSNALGANVTKLTKLNTIGDLFIMIGNKIAYGFKKIVEGIKSLASGDTDTVVSSIKKKLGPLAPLFQGLIDLFKGLWSVLKVLLPVIGTILSAIGNLLTQVSQSLVKTFNTKIGNNGGFNLWYLINGGIGLLIAKGLYDFVFLFNGITSAIANTIDALGSVLRAKAVMTWAIAIKTVASAILMLVAAILIITLIDEAKLKTAVNTLISIMGVMAIIIAAMAHFLKTTYVQTRELPSFQKGKGLFGGKVESSGSSFAGAAGMILAFGLAVLALTAALKIIDSINPDSIARDLGILAAVMGMLAVAVGIMNAIANIGSDVKGGIKGIKGVLSFAIAIWVLMIPLKKLGDMPWDKLRQGLIAVGALMLAYAVSVKIANGVKAKSMSKMTVMAAGMAALVGPVTLLGAMSKKAVLKGVGAVIALGLMFGHIAALSDDFKMASAVGLVAVIFVFGQIIKMLVDLINGPISEISNKAIRNYSIIAGSVLIFVGLLVASIDKINKKTKQVKPTDKKNTLKALAIIAGVLLMLSAVAYLLMQTATVIHSVNWGAFASGIALFASVILATIGLMEYAKRAKISSEALSNLAYMSIIFVALSGLMFSIGFLAKNLGGLGTEAPKTIGLILTSMVLILISLFTLTQLSKNNSPAVLQAMLGISTVLVALSVMLLALAATIKIINSLSLSGINILIVIATSVLVAFSIFAIASTFKEKIMYCAKAMIALGAALSLFGLGALAFAGAAALMKSNVVGILLVAGAMISLAVAAKLLGSTQPTLLMIAVAFAAMGLAVLAVGAAAYLIIFALEKMLPMLDELAAKSDQLKIILSDVVQGIIEGVAKALPEVIKQLRAAVDIFVDWLLEKGKAILNWFMNLDISKVKAVVDKLVEIVFAIILAALTALEKNIKPITDNLINITLSAIYALIDRLPDIAQALFDLVIGLIEAFGQALENNAERLRQAIVNFAKSAWQAFLNFFGIHSPSKESESAAGNIIQGLINGLSKGISSVAKVLVKLGSQMLKEVLKLPKQFIKAGAETFKAYLSGLKSIANSIIDFGKSLWNKLKNIFKGKSSSTEFKDAGKTAMASYKDGMETVDDDVNSTAKKVIEDVVDELSKTEYFRAIGVEIVKNIALGITDSSIDISEAISETLYDAVDRLEGSYDDLNDVIGSAGIDKFIGAIENSMFSSLAGVVNTLDRTFVQPLTSQFDSAMRVVKALSPNIEGEMSRLATILESGSKLGEAGKNAIVQYISDVSDIAVTKINGWSEALSTCMTSVNEIVQAKLSILNKALNDGSAWLSSAIASLKDLIESELDFSDEEITIRPVMDISDIEDKTGQIAGMLYSVGSISVASASYNAERASSEIAATKQMNEAASTNTQTETVSDQSGVYNVTFNITGNDPKAIADEVSKRFQQYTSRRNIAYGK